MKPKNPAFYSRVQEHLHEIIFEADTRSGRAFDILLIITILFSVVIVMLDSVSELHLRYGNLFFGLEWFFTILFSVEYLVRIIASPRPLSYIFSFYGIIDLLAIIPTYLSIFLPGSRYLTIIRLLRVLRVFRVLKLVQYVGEAHSLKQALKASRHKIMIFIFTVLTITAIIGSLMYLIEGEASGFTNIPMSIYWAIVTLTTVGYGDISPITPLGRAIAAIIMIMGYGIIAVPTGIVTMEMANVKKRAVSTQVCPSCSKEGHDPDAVYCKYCGEKL